MDNRLRFLYCSVTELRGHGGEAGAGDGEPGASGAGEGQENPSLQSETVTRSETYSSEAGRPAVEKSRYGSCCTRTVNRHRWMGRESQGRRKKYCQGTRQNDPVTSGEGVPAGAGRRE